MIKVNVKKTEGIIESITMIGHACFDDYGKDIVCAGVSTALITTVNSIIAFDKDSIIYENNKDFKLVNIKKDEVTNKLLDNLLNMLHEFESEYSKNIKVKEEIL